MLGAMGIVALPQIQELHEPKALGAEWRDPLATSLRSATGDNARLERRKLVDGWRQRGLADRSQTEAAFNAVLRVRRVLGEAFAAGQSEADGWAVAIESRITMPLVGELEEASTVLARSSLLSPEARSSIGWQWGACGWRQCGAQADAAQALCKLRSNLGMLAPLEAVYYLDVAIRAADEILLLGASEGMVDRRELPRSEYLSRATLDKVLAVDEEEADKPQHKVLGTRRRGEKQFDLEEAVLSEQGQEFEEVIMGGGDTDSGDSLEDWEG